MIEYFIWGGALLLTFPCAIYLASLFFANPEQDAEDDSLEIPAALLDQTPMTIIGVKIVLFLVVCGAFATAFYKLGSWILSVF